MRWYWFWPWVLTALTLTGCSGWVVPYQLDATNGPEVVLAAGHSVGQTFMARHAGLEGLDVYLIPRQPGVGLFRFHLRADIQAPIDIAVATLSVAQLVRPGFYHFSFAPLPDSENHSYYAYLEAVGTGTARVGTNVGGSYLDGMAYFDQHMVDGQFAFKLIYARWPVVMEFGQTAALWLLYLGLAALVYVLPGWAALAWLWPQNCLSWGERLGLACGISLAVYPLLILWTDVVKLHLAAGYVWLPVLAGAGVLAWRARGRRPSSFRMTWRAWRQSGGLWPDLALVGVLGLVFAVRFWVIRTVDIPMWGDSYQHTIIAQLLVDHGGLFTSWQPYADLQTFTYHFAFHSAVAVWHWVSGMDLPKATLWAGQILNGLAVITLYPLAVRLGRNRWAGVGAVLAGGLLSPMPMYFVNWGRYTQLTGQIILPVLWVLVVEALESGWRDWRRAGLALIVVAGMWLAHYEVMIFALLVLGAWLLVKTLRRPFTALPWIRVSSLWVLSLVVAAPWVVNIVTNYLPVVIHPQIHYSAESGQAFFMFPPADFFPIGHGFYAPVYLALVALSGLALGLWQRNRWVWTLAVWWGALLVAANLFRVNIPVVSFQVDGFSVFIAAYIPVASLAGATLGYASSFMATRWTKFPCGAVLAVAVGLAAGAGGAQRLTVKNDAFTLVTAADEQAMVWIRAHTSPGAKFLVNSFFATGPKGFVAGSDGGWWMPLLAGRRNNLLPANYIYEHMPPADWAELYDLAEIEPAQVNTPEALATLRRYGVTYVYLGRMQGSGRFRVTDFGSLAYVPVYAQDGVTILAVRNK